MSVGKLLHNKLSTVAAAPVIVVVLLINPPEPIDVWVEFTIVAVLPTSVPVVDSLQPLLPNSSVLINYISLSSAPKLSEYPAITYPPSVVC